VTAASQAAPNRAKTPAGRTSGRFTPQNQFYGVVVVVVVVSFFSIIALAGLLITTLRTIIRFPSLT
jgi:hypothetical protein